MEWKIYRSPSHGIKIHIFKYTCITAQELRGVKHFDQLNFFLYQASFKLHTFVHFIMSRLLCSLPPSPRATFMSQPHLKQGAHFVLEQINKSNVSISVEQHVLWLNTTYTRVESMIYGV